MKKIGILIYCLIAILLFPQKVYAEEILSEKEPMEIVFVIDCSGSMKSNDSSKMGLNMVQAFIDTDLPLNGARTKEQSNEELRQCVSRCKEEKIQIHTVAFGKYDGNKAVLEEIAAETEADSYSAQGPEELINILYGLFQDSLAYKIQQFSSGIYAGGNQEITSCKSRK